MLHLMVCSRVFKPAIAPARIGDTQSLIEMPSMQVDWPSFTVSSMSTACDLFPFIVAELVETGTALRNCMP